MENVNSEFVNLTPHDIVLQYPSGARLTIPPSGTEARVDSVSGVLRETVDSGIPIYEAPTWGEVEGLPDPESGKIFIVSGLVASRSFGRKDVVSPGTGPKDGVIRNEKGHVVAVTRLIAAPESFVSDDQLSEILDDLGL